MLVSYLNAWGALPVALLLCLRLCVSSVLPVPMVAQVGQQLFVALRLAMKSSIGYSSVDQVKHPHARLVVRHLDVLSVRTYCHAVAAILHVQEETRQTHA
jgi:hypothetical protein